MRRVRLSTLLWMVAVASLVLALVARRERAARREAELQARIARTRQDLLKAMVGPNARQTAAVKNPGTPPRRSK